MTDTSNLYCGCFKFFCNVRLCVRVCLVMCGCSDNCVGVLVICVLKFTVLYIVCTVFLYCFVYIHFMLISFVCTSVRTTATGLKLNCSSSSSSSSSNNNNNNNNNNTLFNITNLLCLMEGAHLSVKNATGLIPSQYMLYACFSKQTTKKSKTAHRMRRHKRKF